VRCELMPVPEPSLLTMLDSVMSSPGSNGMAFSNRDLPLSELKTLEPPVALMPVLGVRRLDLDARVPVAMAANSSSPSLPTPPKPIAMLAAMCTADDAAEDDNPSSPANHS
jgi:hypothetical protein